MGTAKDDPADTKEEDLVNEIRPIGTRYASCHFRSRLEARWAVLFDYLKIRWEYEPQGFMIGTRPYLPDFRLPGLGVWAEVKGAEDKLDKGFMQQAAALPGGILILGPIPAPLPDGEDWAWPYLHHEPGIGLIVERAALSRSVDKCHLWIVYEKPETDSWTAPSRSYEDGYSQGREYTAALSARFEWGEQS